MGAVTSQVGGGSDLQRAGVVLEEPMAAGIVLNEARQPDEHPR